MSAARNGWVRACASFIADSILAESDRWFLWVPVFFGVGIAVYFSLHDEPGALAAVAAPLGASGLLLLLRGNSIGWPVSAAMLIAALGFADAKLRVAILDTPVLAKKTGPVMVTGWIEHAEPRGEKNHRLVVRVIALADKRGAIPHLPRVRLTSRFGDPPSPGAAVKMRAILRPLPDPVMPGGFDFARSVWFDGISAVGFTLSAPEPVSGTPKAGMGLSAEAAVARLRHGVDERVHDALPGDAGAVATALLTGLRGRIPEETLQALRHSGLAHLLAISGLHMALIAGSLYWLLRAFLAAVPAIALRLPVKKIAALAALGGGAFYLALSGAGIATQRAFLMMGIMSLAVLLDRPAITLRNVALAALVVLTLFPESLFDVSFQMSFAAAAALVAFYERWSQRQSANQSRPDTPFGLALRRSGTYLAGIALTTIVAGIAVAPFAAYHFHKLAQFSLAANLAAMPVFGLVIMPAALAALLAIPFGLEYWPLQTMAWGISCVADIAETVSGWEGAVVRVAEMPAVSLAALAFGGLWIAIWRTRWRYAGLVIAACGLMFAPSLQRPDILIGRDGGLVAVRDATGKLGVRAGRGNSYSLERWLAADADPRDAKSVRSNPAFHCDDIACLAEVRGKSVAVLLHPAAIREECARADIVIASFPLGNRCEGARVNVDLFDLHDGGAHALYLDGQSIRTESVAQKRGKRPWTGPHRTQRTQTARNRESESGTARASEKNRPEETENGKR